MELLLRLVMLTVAAWLGHASAISRYTSGEFHIYTSYMPLTSFIEAFTLGTVSIRKCSPLMSFGIYKPIFGITFYTLPMLSKPNQQFYHFFRKMRWSIWTGVNARANWIQNSGLAYIGNHYSYLGIAHWIWTGALEWIWPQIHAIPVQIDYWENVCKGSWAYTERALIQTIGF